MKNATIQLSESAREILERFPTVPQRALAGIAAGMDRQNQLTLAHITVQYLSFAKDGPVSPIGLRVQSNRLRGSMRASKARVEGQTVTSGIGSNVAYAGAHEFGAVIPPRRIFPKNGSALRFFAQGKPVFCKWVDFPGAVLPERAFTRRGIADRMEHYGNSASRRVIAALAGEDGGGE